MRVCKSTSAIRRVHGNVRPTRVPTGCYVSTSQRAQTSACTAPMRLPPLRPHSIGGRARPSNGERLKKRLTNFYNQPTTTSTLRRQFESSHDTSEPFQKLMADHGVICSMSRSGNVWDNAAMESFFSSLKTERTARKTYRTRDEAKADVFDYIERFYNPKRRHSTIGYLSPMEFERQAGLA